jgi:hypothetical protein
VLAFSSFSAADSSTVRWKFSSASSHGALRGVYFVYPASATLFVALGSRAKLSSGFFAFVNVTKCVGNGGIMFFFNILCVSTCIID